MVSGSRMGDGVPGVLVDVFYDHFLASHWHEFHPEPLADFAAAMTTASGTCMWQPVQIWLRTTVMPFLPRAIRRSIAVSP